MRPNQQGNAMCINPENELLQQCIASGQVDACQIAQHVAVGEYRSTEERTQGGSVEMTDTTGLKRYCIEETFDGARMVEDETGGWVMHSDFAVLLSQLEAREAEIAELNASREADIERAVRLTMQRVHPEYSLGFYEVVESAVISQMKEPK